MAATYVKQANLKVTGGPAAHDCKVELDGVDISHHTSGLSFSAAVDGGAIKATLELFASVEFDGIAEVEIHSRYGAALVRIDELERELADARGLHGLFIAGVDTP